MQYTNSADAVVHGGTGRKMHSDAGPIDTVLTALDVNQLIWGLMELLNDAGIAGATFDPSNVATYNRISAAVAARATGLFTGGSNVLKANPGFQRLPSGVILQQGEYTSDLAVVNPGVTTPTSVTFPLAFPTACRAVLLSARNPANDAVADSWPELVSKSLTSFSMVPQNAGVSGSSLVLHGFCWLAIGD